MEEISIKTWAQFEAILAKIEKKRNARGKPSRGFEELLFRGVGSSDWGLETTLERSFPAERCDETLSLLQYYAKVARAQPAIETFTGRPWQGIPSLPEFREKLEQSEHSWLDFTLMREIGIYEYLVYLRHHAFPSPMLDWSASPYVGAFFAYDAPPSNSSHVSLFVLLRDSIHGGSSDAHLFVVGPYMRSHSRHILQQCNYTMCVTLRSNPRDYEFAPHGIGLRDALGPRGQLFKITMPIALRTDVLRHLDSMNINPYSLFGSEDSLVRTIARRECLFRKWWP